MIAAKRRKRHKGAMKTQTEIFQLCDRVRETAFALHRYLRHGHLGVLINFGSGKIEIRKYILSDAV
jgi:hypothetical protein